jgi:N-(2-amino-2-carboxyethyl)-L-glutamate synthase
VVLVEEEETIRTCHRLAQRGFVFGGSTGTVVSAAVSWLTEHDASDLTAVAISPDFGERYLDTVYRPNWLEEQHAEDAVGFDQVTPLHRAA